MKKGFTLVELLVVIAIVGVLAAAILVAINPAERIAEARDSQTKQDIGSIATGLTTYFTRNSLYPTSLTDLALPVGDLKTIPIAPVDGPEEGGTVRTYDTPYSTNGTATEASIFWQMTALSNGAVAGAANNNVWCFRTVTGQASSVASPGATTCAP